MLPLATVGPEEIAIVNSLITAAGADNCRRWLCGTGGATRGVDGANLSIKPTLLIDQFWKLKWTKNGPNMKHRKAGEPTCVQKVGPKWAQSGSTIDLSNQRF